jgi:hypothetical protein
LKSNADDTEYDRFERGRTLSVSEDRESRREEEMPALLDIELRRLWMESESASEPSSRESRTTGS